MLVWNEVYDDWFGAEYDFAQTWRQDVTAWVRRDRNHPSVIIWSIGNEVSAAAGLVAQGTAMADLVRSLDTTRPVSQGGQGQTTDASWSYVDIGDVHYAEIGRAHV